MAARERLRHEVWLVAGMQLVAEVLDMALDGARSDSELLGALLRGEPASNALQDLAFSFR